MNYFFFAIASTPELRFYQILSIFFFTASVILYVAVVILRRRVQRFKQSGVLPSLPPVAAPKPPQKKQEPPKAPPVVQPATPLSVQPKILPNPGVVFKYSLADEATNEKFITIGQDEGSIKLYSTEIANDHLSLYIRIVDSERDRSIYDIPDKLVEKYLVDIRRSAKTLVLLPDEKEFQEMDSRMRVYIQPEKEEMGELTFSSIEATNPIRFRLGDRLNQDGKFIRGFFEFHLFAKDYQVKTKAGVPKVEKFFFIRLFKIYPGYDTGNVTADGLYPMIDPFTTG